MENIKQTILKGRPNLKPNSVNQYAAQLRKLLSLFETDNLSFLDQPKEVTEKIKDLHYTSRRNVYNSVIVYLYGVDDPKNEPYIKEYISIRDKLNDQYFTEQASGKISEKQEKNLVDIKEIENMIDTLNKEVKEIKKKLSFNRSEISTIRSWILLNMLTRIPTRNDASNMLFISQAEYKKLTLEDKQQHNYLVNKRDGLYFVYNDYKTSKIYKENKIDAPKELQKLLKQYIKMMGFKVGDNIFPMSRNALTQLLIKTSQKYMGKNISTTLIRKSYISSKYGNTKNEMEADAKKMMHSIQTQQGIYNKSKN